MSDDDPFAFFVPGVAATKGSTRSFKHARTGAVVTVGANKRTKSWEARVALAAREAGIARAPKGEGVRVGVVFTFARPSSHLGTGRNAGKVKASAPAHPTTRAVGDVDKLLRAVLDGLDGIAYDDDSQVTAVHAAKRYGDEPGALVRVEAVSPAP